MSATDRVHVGGLTVLGTVGREGEDGIEEGDATAIASMRGPGTLGGRAEGEEEVVAAVRLVRREVVVGMTTRDGVDVAASAVVLSR